MARRSELQAGGFDLHTLVTVFVRGWLIVAICTVIAGYAAVKYLRTATYVYPAQMQITPVQSTGDDSSRLSALSGLASVAGISLPGSQNASLFRLYMDTLTSRELALELVKDEALMRKLFSADWDASQNMWREPPMTDADKYKQALRAFLGFPPAVWTPPTASSLQGLLKERVQIIQDPRKPYLVTIEFDDPDANFAVGFLNLLNRAADGQLRQRALLRAKQYIDYLSKQLATTTVAEHRLAITQTLSEQEKYAMAAGSAAPFAAEVFDRAAAGTLPSEPQPRKVLLTYGLAGALIGGLLSFLLLRAGVPLGGWLGVRFRRRLQLAPGE